jgi:hypothetical protein
MGLGRGCRRREEPTLIAFNFSLSVNEQFQESFPVGGKGDLNWQRNRKVIEQKILMKRI